MESGAEPVAVTTCYLLRHCDVQNPGGVIYGHLPGFGLSPKGRVQARNQGRYLAAGGISGIYSSPLERALETADLIQRELPSPVPLEHSRLLIEAEFGRYLQGVPYRQIPWRRPRWLVHMVWPGLVPSDESMGEMYRRVRVAIGRGLERHRGSAFACISHGDPIQAYWATLDRRPPWALHRLQCAKGGLLELRFRQGEMISRTYLSPGRIAQAVGGPEPLVEEPLPT